MENNNVVLGFTVMSEADKTWTLTVTTYLRSYIYCEGFATATEAAAKGVSYLGVSSVNLGNDLWHVYSSLDRADW